MRAIVGRHSRPVAGHSHSGAIEPLILCNTSAFLGPAEQWERRITSLLEDKDMVETTEMFLRNWFPPRWLEADGPTIAKFRAMLRRYRHASQPQRTHCGDGTWRKAGCPISCALVEYRTAARVFECGARVPFVIDTQPIDANFFVSREPFRRRTTRYISWRKI